jgi:hypothetical protein
LYFLRDIVRIKEKRQQRHGATALLKDTSTG